MSCRNADVTYAIYINFEWRKAVYGNTAAKTAL